jgi:hypothetical protein
MSFHSMRLAFAAVLIGLLVCGCGGTGSPAPPPAGGITVTPGDGQVTITWIPDPGVTYWLFFAQADSISTESLSTPHQCHVTLCCQWSYQWAELFVHDRWPL